MITSNDVDLIRLSRAQRRFDEISTDQLAAYERVHNALGHLANQAVSRMGPGAFEAKLTSGFTPQSGVRGALPKDLWFGVFPKDPSDRLAGNPQLFLIVSERGLEYGFGATTHPSDFSNADIKDKVREAAEFIFPRLPVPGSTKAQELAGALQRNGGWTYRRKQRLDVEVGDFQSLDAWLADLRSPQGIARAGGSISKLLRGPEIDRVDLSKELIDAADMFAPLLLAFTQSMDERHRDETPSPQPAVEAESGQHIRRFWIEKTIVSGRPDRETGEHALGRALWSPQRDQRGADIYRNMREVQAGDIVLHITDNEAFSGVSQAAAPVDDSFVGLSGTSWEGPAYRIPLQGFEPLDPPLVRGAFFDREPYRSELRVLLDSGVRGLFYNTNLELNQGAYLTEAPQALIEILNCAYFDDTGHALPYFEPPETFKPADHVRSFNRQALLDKLFLEEPTIEQLLALWRTKKNLILQGAPGVGKSFVAKALAELLTESHLGPQIELVQFHQSYSYEDFVQGYRPDGVGGFCLQDGVLKRFRDQAVAEPDKRFVIIIDEINRGNLAKIFGELMLLIEPDKRGPEWAVSLPYSPPHSAKFFIPDNLYLLGTMNTADRSLAMIDYAMRRRFAFQPLEPQFRSSRFAELLSQRGASEALITKIRSAMAELNEVIAGDRSNLGPGFCIGHSFFIPDPGGVADEAWYETVIRTEIHPLLQEYWFDDPQRADDLCSRFFV